QAEDGIRDKLVTGVQTCALPIFTRFVNKIMISGKKTVAQSLVYDAMEEIKKKSNQDPIGIFEKAIQNVAPKMEVRPRRVGGASRSEERRVGKESRYRRWQNHKKK